MISKLVLSCLSIFVISCILSGIFWWQYDVSGDTIIRLDGYITEIDTTSVDDCDPFTDDKHKLIFHYNYTYHNETYEGEYETCETNKGTEAQLELHPVGSKIIIYAHSNDISNSAPGKFELMNKVFLAFGIIFSILIFVSCMYVICNVDTAHETFVTILNTHGKDITKKVGSSIV